VLGGFRTSNPDEYLAGFYWHPPKDFSFCAVLILLMALFASPAYAEETEPIHPEPDSDQSDIFYTAMLESIELGKTRWKSFSRSMESGPWFYDTQELKRNRSTVTAVVTAYPHPNRTELYRSVYPEHTKIRKIIFVTEINCSKHTYRQPKISVYGYYKELLVEHLPTGKAQKFSPIKPGTTTDTLRTLICTPLPRH
jgi:hypothetical protein